MLTGDEVARMKSDMFKVEREKAIDLDPVYPKIFKVITQTKGAGDKYTQLLGAGRLIKKTVQNEDIIFAAPIQGWTSYVKFHTWQKGIKFSKEAVEDALKLGDAVKDLAETWADYVIIAKEELAARVFNHGGDTSGDWAFLGSFLDETDSSGLLLYDSKPLFNLTGNARTTKGGETYYTSVAGLTVTPDNFETLYNLATATNNRGEEDEVKRNKVDTALCRPGADKFDLEKIVDTTRGLPGGQLNDKNVYYGIIGDVIPWDYLDSDAGFFLGRKNDEKVCFYERQSQETDFFRDNTNRAYKASIDVRFGVHLKPLAWRAWVRGGGTSVAGGATE